MPKTGAERQQAWRDRRARCIAALAADRAGLAGARGHLAGALTEAERLAPGNASTQPPQPTAAATPAVPTCGDPSRPPRRRLIAYATNASAPAMQTDSGHFSSNTGRIATSSENSPLTGTIQ